MGNCLDGISILEQPSKLEPLSSPQKSRKCNACGEVFEEKWDEKLGVYESFTICPECRNAAAKAPKATANVNYQIKYEPFDYQAAMHQSAARFRIVAGGIRTGKDYSMVFELFKYLVDCANEDRDAEMLPKVRGWIVAPSESLAKEDFRQLNRIIPREMVAAFSKSTNTIVLNNGVEIECKSAYDPESLVGIALDAVLITEAARIKDLEDVWSNLEGRLNSPGRGKNGMGGIGLINSSPLGKNFFYKMWTWGRKESPDYDSDWGSFQWSHWDNPYMKEKENRKDKSGLTYRQRLERRSSLRYRQDYLAEFLLDEFCVFPQFEKNCLESVPKEVQGKNKQVFIDEWRAPKPYNSYTIGYDPARIADEPIMWITENETGKLMKAVNMKGQGWDAQFNTIAMYSRLYNGAAVRFGRTGHDAVDSQLINRGLLTVPINEQGPNKENLVENLARIVEGKLLVVLDDGEEITETIKSEFADYVRVQGKSTVYKNSTNDAHDDHVSAAYFAFSAVNSIATAMPFTGLVMGELSN